VWLREAPRGRTVVVRVLRYHCILPVWRTPANGFGRDPTGPRMRPTGRRGGRLARYNSRVSRRQFSPSVIGPAEKPLGEVNPLLHLGELISEPCKLVVQRIQLLLVRWIARVSRNAPCDGFAEPRPGQQQQPSDADDYEWDRHDEHFGNALKDLEVHAPLDEAGASKVSSRNGDPPRHPLRPRAGR